MTNTKQAEVSDRELLELAGYFVESSPGDFFQADEQFKEDHDVIPLYRKVTRAAASLAKGETA